MKVYVVIYDGDEYESGHVYGAFSTLKGAKARLAELDTIAQLDAHICELTLDEPADKRP